MPAEITPEITTEYMMSMLAKSKPFTLVLLTRTAKYQPDAAKDSEQAKIIWAHGKRNFELRASGKMPLVGPVLQPPYAGMAVFDCPAAEVAEIMAGDPAVQAGYFTVEIMPWRSFPGDALPG